MIWWIIILLLVIFVVIIVVVVVLYSGEPCNLGEPTNLKSEATENFIRLTWDPSTGSPDGYVVYVGDIDGFQPSNENIAKITQDTQAEVIPRFGTIYYKVAAYKGDINSETPCISPTTEIKVENKCPPNLVPKIPVITRAIILQDNNVLVEWVPLEETPSYYLIYEGNDVDFPINNDNIVGFAVGSEVTTRLSYLSKGGKFVKITATNNYGENVCTGLSSPSTEIISGCTTLLPPPRLESATVNRVSWSKVDGADGYYILSNTNTGYTINDPSTVLSYYADSGDITSFTDLDFPPPLRYIMAVSIKKQDGYICFSNPSNYVQIRDNTLENNTSANRFIFRTIPQNTLNFRNFLNVRNL